MPEYIYQRITYLNGSFHGELFSSVTNTKECEDIKFVSFNSAKELTGVLTGAFTAYGKCSVLSYTNDHLLEVSKTCYFGFPDIAVIEENKEGDKFIISFYQCNDKGEVIGREEKRIIQIQNQDKFLMRRYGLTEENNLVYTRQ